jgi:hypothetical protein
MRMLDDKYEPQALTTICLYTRVVDEQGTSQYQFVTNRVDVYPAKTPLGMFEEQYIPNDLNLVINKIQEYYD